MSKRCFLCAGDKLTGPRGEHICFGCHAETDQALADLTERKNVVVRECHELQDEVAKLKKQLAESNQRFEQSMKLCSGAIIHSAELLDRPTLAAYEQLQRRLREAETEVERWRATMDKPVEVLFADGRQPTENERHLLNLLSWREQENRQAREETKRLRDAWVRWHSEIEQLLGNALYGTGEDGLPLWGEHTAVTLAQEAARVLQELRQHGQEDRAITQASGG